MKHSIAIALLALLSACATNPIAKNYQPLSEGAPRKAMMKDFPVVRAHDPAKELSRLNASGYRVLGKARFESEIMLSDEQIKEFAAQVGAHIAVVSYTAQRLRGRPSSVGLQRNDRSQYERITGTPNVDRLVDVRTPGPFKENLKEGQHLVWQYEVVYLTKA